MQESITLSYHRGSAELLYRLAIEPRAGGYVVSVAHGRRGTTLQIETETPVPVSYVHAQRIYNGLVARKIAAGYAAVGAPREPEPPAAEPVTIGPAASVRPRQTRALHPDHAARLLTDPDWCVQERFDGQRLLFSKTPESIEAVTTDGLAIVLPEPVRAAAAKTKFSWLMDGVLTGDIFTAFDLPQFDVMNFRAQTYRMRLAGLRTLLRSASRHLRVAETEVERAAKVAFVQRLRAAGRSGIVLKRFLGMYPCGCPSCGGSRG